MASIPLPAARVAAQLPDHVRPLHPLSIAAVNGPRSTVVSGSVEAVEAIVTHYRAQDVRARRVPVDYASHSPAMEALRTRLLTDLRHIAPRTAPGTVFYSSLTGGALDTAGLDADYWYRNLRWPVEFQQAVSAALADGHRTVVESSPHPVLIPGIEQIIEQTAGPAADASPAGQPAAVATGTLRRDQGGLGAFLLSAGQLYVAGVAVRLADEDGPVADLPTYAFQRRRHWLPAPASGGSAVARTGVPAAEDPRAEPAGPREVWADRLAGRPPADQQRQLLDLVRSVAAAVLGSTSTDAVPAQRGFLESKIDSLAAVEVRNRINAATGLNLPSTSVFDLATPAALAEHLRELLVPRPEQQTVAVRTGPRGVDAATPAPGPLLDPAAFTAATDEELFALIDNGIGTV
jgi:acyl transferase domain-containing protein